MPKSVVIVESPAKAKTIGQFLGDGYKVVASFGHVRDLPESAKDIPEELKKQKWAKLGVNTESRFEPLYVVTADKKTHVAELRKAAKDASVLMLATDEDREGESISWHVLELLKPKKGVRIERIVFHEITREAILAAVKNPRQLDESLVRAQETRRILDRLYGYTLSPLLWKKVRPRLSAGRVQSVAVRLVVMREKERRDFVTVDYASVSAQLSHNGTTFASRLERIGGKPVADGSDFDDLGNLTRKNAIHLELAAAKLIADGLATAEPWTVTKAETKPGVENPPVPFMTSSLQQEANRKFGYPARRTMQIAQALYEGVDIGGGAVGLITYMRTDSLTLAERALQEARGVIRDMYGPEYLPQEPKRYKSKAKNAQEAHEAIRPTDLSRTPTSIKSRLTDEQFKLYDLIWKRTVACQMVPARVERTKVETTVPLKGDDHVFTASGKAILFPGFLRAYVEGADDPESDLDDKETLLPSLKVGDNPTLASTEAVKAASHQTKPPARYTEATLVKKLEEEGIGRPSTYASIIGTIQDRGYVNKTANQLVPTFTAFAVTQLLEGSFPQLVDLKFTAQMEDQLDDIADGKRDMVDHLKNFYYGDTSEPGIAEKVEKQGPDIPFPHISLGEDIVVRIGKNGPFVQRGEGGPGNTASVPDDLPPADLDLEKALSLLSERERGPEPVGTDAATGRAIFAKTGRFGDYLELEADPDQLEPPKRVSLPPGVKASQLTTADTQALLEFPKTLGNHPESGEPVVLMLGRYGAYLSCGEKKANVGDWRESLALDLTAAVEALSATKPGRGSAEKTVFQDFGKLPGAEGDVQVVSGRFGPYVTDGKTNATLPKTTDPEKVTQEEALALLLKKKEAGPSKRRKFTRRRK